jgi:hypothetical protein
MPQTRVGGHERQRLGCHCPVDALITSGRQLDVARLADTDVALETL